MLILASSSNSRANLLQKAHIAFTQVFFDYDENLEKTLKADESVQKIVLNKEKQFCQQIKDTDDKTILFADSIVSVGGAILTKAKTKEEALYMLNLQSNNSVDILSAFLLKAPQKRIFSLSKTTLFFKQFDANECKTYIQSDLYKGKAGALMCEGFHKKYIIKQIGNTSTSLGLDTDTLKAYL
ncbi:septum formation inhibitor Maf [Campylobacter sp. MIT 21-1685]|uniref:septum formation inhibitor Maf n=1 Tax=unclassified Campylobacter TaxID=2593542 RepID=UPI00224AD0D0|nr:MULTISPECIES: septum formation inhibitor Maf [unclassified Campylobacter]MCX2682883.1 septum formation inhibitor Maf [Campylobacter sp. MIT 21-1684]MCX2751169.1 septum formation inhibitor Maf [Campylobacter sp. MIT 21-1682]MCX2807364.1 septum formation inhibitor Maf [Campylobacter sp. MIT 21-1685]